MSDQVCPMCGATAENGDYVYIGEGDFYCHECGNVTSLW